MPVTEEFIDLKDSKKIVVKTLKEYGSLGYSRLLMLTSLPENILKKCLELLIRDQMLQREEDIEPKYQLTSKGLSSFWNF